MDTLHQITYLLENAKNLSSIKYHYSAPLTICSLEIRVVMKKIPTGFSCGISLENKSEQKRKVSVNYKIELYSFKKDNAFHESQKTFTMDPFQRCGVVSELASFISGNSEQYFHKKSAISILSFVITNVEVVLTQPFHMAQRSPVYSGNDYYVPQPVHTDLFTGMINHGATCYINSLIQTLFHISAFRSAVFRLPKRTESELENTNTKISAAIQLLFTRLSTSKSAVGSTDLTNAFGWSPSEASQQHDVQELNRMLISSLDESVKDDEKLKGIFSHYFSGVISNKIVCAEGHISAKDEVFLDVSLPVAGSTSLTDSLKDYTKVEELEGDNKFRCPFSKELENAKKQMLFKSIPDILFIQLMRFTFNAEMGNNSKLDDFLFFEPELNLKEHFDDNEKLTEADSLYSLYAVLSHRGEIRSGHYSVDLRIPKHAHEAIPTWYHFNDHKVTTVVQEKVLEENFGGNDTHQSAYILVYVKKCKTSELFYEIDKENLPAHALAIIEAEKEALNYTNINFIYGKHIMNISDLIDFPLKEFDSIKCKKNETVESFLNQIKPNFPPDKMLRLWNFCERRNSTIRPQKLLKPNDIINSDLTSYPFFVEVTDIITDYDSRMIFFKYFDVQTNKFRFVCHLNISSYSSLQTVFPILLRQVELDDNTPLMCSEEMRPDKVVPIDETETVKTLDLRNGDIVVFQIKSENVFNKVFEKKVNVNRVTFEPIESKEWHYLSNLHGIRIETDENNGEKENETLQPMFVIEFNSKTLISDILDAVGDKFSLTDEEKTKLALFRKYQGEYDICSKKQKIGDICPKLDEKTRETRHVSLYYQMLNYDYSLFTVIKQKHVKVFDKNMKKQAELEVFVPEFALPDVINTATAFAYEKDVEYSSKIDFAKYFLILEARPLEIANANEPVLSSFLRLDEAEDFDASAPNKSTISYFDTRTNSFCGNSFLLNYNETELVADIRTRIANKLLLSEKEAKALKLFRANSQKDVVLVKDDSEPFVNPLYVYFGICFSSDSVEAKIEFKDSNVQL